MANYKYIFEIEDASDTLDISQDKVQKAIQDAIKEETFNGVSEVYWDYRDLEPENWADGVIDWKNSCENFNDYHSTKPFSNKDFISYKAFTENKIFEQWDDTSQFIDDAWFHDCRNVATSALKKLDIDPNVDTIISLANQLYESGYIEFENGLDSLNSIKYRSNILLTFNEEANYDCCTLANAISMLHSDEILDDNFIDDFQNTALGWLVYQQGYTFNDLMSDKESPFLNSVREEIDNFFHYTGNVTLLASLNPEQIEQLIDEDVKNIDFGKDLTLGFFTQYGGGGSLLGIELEKPLVVPTNMIFDIQVEEATNNSNYTVDETYGLVGSCWKDIELYETDAPNYDFNERIKEDINKYIDVQKTVCAYEVQEELKEWQCSFSEKEHSYTDIANFTDCKTAELLDLGFPGREVLEEAANNGVLDLPNDYVKLENDPKYNIYQNQIKTAKPQQKTTKQKIGKGINVAHSKKPAQIQKDGDTR